MTGITQYIIRRVAWMLVILLGIATITFLMSTVLPGDPVRIYAGRDASEEVLENVRKQLGLDQPLHIRYVTYIGNLLRGNLGQSFRRRTDVAPEVLARLPATLQLALAGIIIQAVFGLGVGIISALKQHKPVDKTFMLLCLIGVCTPVFVVGIFLLFLFAYIFPIFPLGGTGGPMYLVLPAITLGLTGVSWYARIVRSSMLDVINADFVRTARAKGLKEVNVIMRHALRNALGPITTMLGIGLGRYMGGVLVIEKVFSWPGMGSLAWNAVDVRDTPIVMGTVLIAAFFIVGANLLVDIIQAWIDPRVRYDRV